jgi:hypothetical protein
VQFVSKTKYYFGKGYVELCLNEHIRPYVLEGTSNNAAF